MKILQTKTFAPEKPNIKKQNKATNECLAHEYFSHSHT